MQKFLSKYGVAAHLAMLTVTPLFLFPYCLPSTVATPLVWLSIFAGFWLILEPSRHFGEMLDGARLRVAGSLLRSPLLWTMLFIVVVAALRWANGGVGMAYDIETGKWFIREPSLLPILPSSTDASGYPEFALALALTVLLAGCSHSLGKSARISFLLSASTLSGIAALAAILAVFFGHHGALAAASCRLSTGTFAGTGFGLFFLASLVTFSGVFECRWNRLLALSGFACGANAAGLWFFAPTHVIILYLACGVLVLAASCAHVFVHFNLNSALKCIAVMLLAAIIPVLCALAFAPDTMNADRLAPFQEGGSFFGSGFFEARSVLGGVSHKAFASHPWIGTGLGSFSLDVRFNAAPSDWRIIGSGRDNPLSGWWLLAAERGICGVFFFALPLGFLLFSFVHRACLCIRARAFRAVFLPGVVLAVAAFAALVAETFVDGSALRPECIMAAGSFAALSALSFPASPGKTWQ